MSKKIVAKPGDRFGHLEVISVERRIVGKHNVTMCKCRCICGVVKDTRYSNLQSKSVTSCGCFSKFIKPKTWKAHRPIRAMWNYYQRNAKNRNLDWHLDWDTFQELVKKQCYYCSLPYSKSVKVRDGTDVTMNGIDRLNSSMGYTYENSVSCCRFCNFAKNDSSLEEFKNWLEGVKYGHILNQ